jgi:hypothetical protein
LISALDKLSGLLHTHPLHPDAKDLIPTACSLFAAMGRGGGNKNNNKMKLHSLDLYFYLIQLLTNTYPKFNLREIFISFLLQSWPDFEQNMETSH